MLLFWVLHPPFVEGLCSQSYDVFFYGYTNLQYIQRLLFGLRWIWIGMEIDFFLFQHGMEGFYTSIVLWIPLTAEQVHNPLADQISFNYLARILAFQVAMREDTLSIPDIQACYSLLPVPLSLRCHRHTQWFYGCISPLRRLDRLSNEIRQMWKNDNGRKPGFRKLLAPCL